MRISNIQHRYGSTLAVLAFLCSTSTLLLAQDDFSYFRDAPGRMQRVPTQEISSTPIYLNPLTQRNTREKVEVGFESIQQIDVDIQPKLVDSVPKNHANEVFGEHTQKIAYSNDTTNAVCFGGSEQDASRFSHHPLYFEELNLERHGKSHGRIQPVLSGFRFAATVPLLPYKMTQRPPRSHVQTRDPYPSGLPAPWVPERYPFSRKGLRNELLSIAGVILIIP